MALKLETIKKRKDFLKTTNSGDKILGDFFILQALKKENQIGSRFGFTITKKTAKRANVRNKMKRRLKEAVRRLDSINGGYDFVLIIRNRMLKATFKEIESSLKNMVKAYEV